MSDKEIDGKLNQAKGKVKEGVGKLTNDKSTEVEGKTDQAKGKVEEIIGKATRKIKNAIEGDN